MRQIKDRLIYYGEQSSIHGLRYLAERRRSRCTRVFWSIVLALSVVGTVFIFLGSYDTFVNHAISFATETTYLHWNTSFPAISLCEIWYKNKYWERLDQESFEVFAKSQLQELLSETVFFSGQCYSCHKIGSCPDCGFYLNLTSNYEKYRTKCEDMLFTCKWNGVEFNCCDHFLPLETEYGICYTVNSIHTRSMQPRIEMISNRKTGPGQLEIIPFREELTVHIHSREDVPFINSDSALREPIPIGRRSQILFNVIEIENDEGVKGMRVEQRGCLYPDEVPPNMKVYKYYSYSTCIVQCHVDAQIQYCNCTHHLMPSVYKNQFCDIGGLTCLTAYYETLNRIRAKGYVKKGLVCDCLPSCVEPNYNIILKSTGVLASKNAIRINLQMHALPSQRFKRNVVRNKLDLIVSVGGTVGLFFGASVLSVVEIFYFFCIRKWEKTPQLSPEVEDFSTSRIIVKKTDFPHSQFN